MKLLDSFFFLSDVIKILKQHLNVFVNRSISTNIYIICSILCLTTDISIKVMQEKSVTSARAPLNTLAQPGDRYGVTSSCLGNDHDISVAGSWREVTLPLRNKRKTYPLQTCYEHNMLPLLHAVCLKVLVFFHYSLRKSSDIKKMTEQLYRQNAHI